MFTEQRSRLEARQVELLGRSHALRERLAGDAQVLHRPLAIADGVHAAGRWLIANPWWIAAAVAVPVAMRMRRMAGWGARIWWGWRMWRRVRPLLAHIGRRG